MLISVSAVALPALVFYGAAVLVLQNSGFSLMEILRDPAQQSGASSFLGFVSNIGVWLWVSSFAIILYVCVGILFYVYHEAFTFIDALWLCVATITTVGT